MENEIVSFGDLTFPRQRSETIFASVVRKDRGFRTEPYFCSCLLVGRFVMEENSGMKKKMWRKMRASCCQ